MSGRLYAPWPHPSDVAPVEPMTCGNAFARATSIPRCIEAIQAEQEKGLTTPVVPRMEIPPSMPRRGFQVFLAMAAPSGTEISMATSPVPPSAAASSATASCIICRGTGLIAGSPTATGSPGLVTMPTPSPPLKVTPVPAAPLRRVAQIIAPCVTSGSSPASLMMPARNQSPPESLPLEVSATSRSAFLPLGVTIVTRSGNCPASIAV